jgi:hypothetical protein
MNYQEQHRNLREKFPVGSFVRKKDSMEPRTARVVGHSTLEYDVVDGVAVDLPDQPLLIEIEYVNSEEDLVFHEDMWNEDEVLALGPSTN